MADYPEQELPAAHLNERGRSTGPPPIASPVTRVEYRLAAARYFLKLLVDQQPRRPAFDWVLEAVITTARTVRWLMKAEARNSPLYAEWEKGLKRDPNTEGLFRQINDIRVRVTKQTPINTREKMTIQLELTPGIASKARELRVGHNFRLITGPDGATFVTTLDGQLIGPAKKLRSHQVLDEFPTEDALQVCQRYIDVLEEQYADWRQFRSERLGLSPEPAVRG